MTQPSDPPKKIKNKIKKHIRGDYTNLSFEFDVDVHLLSVSTGNNVHRLNQVFSLLYAPPVDFCE